MKNFCWTVVSSQPNHNSNQHNLTLNSFLEGCKLSHLIGSTLSLRGWVEQEQDSKCLLTSSNCRAFCSFLGHSDKKDKIDDQPDSHGNSHWPCVNRGLERHMSDFSPLTQQVPCALFYSGIHFRHKQTDKQMMTNN